MNKKWICKEVDEELVKRVKEEYGLSDLIAHILVGRNIINKEQMDIFLTPTRNSFYDPFLLPDMEIAVKRIIKAIENKERILIYGDYDVDGITSICVLKKFLEDRGLEVGQVVPNRLNEGYGLNKNEIDKINKKGYKLMLTVDCGISGIDEVEYANSLGIETIVTDHHEPLDILPNAIAVIDPKIKNSKYPFTQLAGVGVVFKLIQAIGIKLKLDEKEYLKFLDFVAIGTISDIVPLIDENRVIAKLGLKLIPITKNIGLKILINSLGYRAIDSTFISFGIAPRINACGRMGAAEEALELFLTDNIEKAQRLKDKLNEYNYERQEIEKNIFKDAIEKIEKEKMLENNCIILSGENWHHGVIGIVASKITEIYFKPTVLICNEEDIGKGSGRSIPGFDLHNALCNSSKYLQKYGGHEMAVGVTLLMKDFNKFKNELEKNAKEKEVDKIIPIINIDKEITEKEITIKNVEDLMLLQPFGEANKDPLFLFKNLKVDSIRTLTEGKHLKLTLRTESGNIITSIGFNIGYKAEEYLIGDKVDVVGTLEINMFNGNKSIQINLKDIMKSL